jgi:tetratricopeptide (TPR) repeat protein
VLLSIPAGILEGEIAAAEDRYEDAVRVLEETVETEDGLTYDEPEPWQHPARHVLGAILLEMDRAEDAERVYREALEDHPRNGWSLFGLEQALRAQGRDSEADRVHEQYERDWARRDIWLRSSRF